MVAAARLRGDWRELEREAAEGLACLRQLTASGQEFGERDMSEAETRFRSPLKLFSADQTLAWLERWQVTVAGVARLHSTSVASRPVGRRARRDPVRFPVAEDEVRRGLGRGRCSGALDEIAWRLAGDAALALDAGESLARRPRAGALAHQAAAADGRDAAVTESAIADEVGRRGLEWLRVEGLLLEVPTEGMAREAAFLVRDDGRPLAEVAVDCGTEARPLGPLHGRSLAGAERGTPRRRRGRARRPLALDDGFALLLLERKARPSTADPQVRAKAVQAVVTRLTERAIAANVSWHEPV